MEWVALVQELELLPSPLDALIDALGGSQAVAEMTGRRGRLVRNSRSGRFKYELRPETEETRYDGCSGDSDWLIFTSPGSFDASSRHRTDHDLDHVDITFVVSRCARAVSHRYDVVAIYSRPCRSYVCRFVVLCSSRIIQLSPGKYACKSRVIQVRPETGKIKYHGCLGDAGWLSSIIYTLRALYAIADKGWLSICRADRRYMLVTGYG